MPKTGTHILPGPRSLPAPPLFLRLDDRSPQNSGRRKLCSFSTLTWLHEVSVFSSHRYDNYERGINNNKEMKRLQ